MLQERRSLILQKVTEDGKVKVADLSKELNCSEVTIRNDIRDMAAEGLLQRIHGGAVSLEKKAEHKYTAESVYRNTEKKKEISIFRRKILPKMAKNVQKSLILIGF